MANKCGTVEIKLTESKGKKIVDKVKSVLADVRSAASKKKITVSGDESSGKIDGKAEWKIWGTYEIKIDEAKNEATMKVLMEEDHWAVDCTYVNDQIKEWFKGK